MVPRGPCGRPNCIVLLLQLSNLHPSALHPKGRSTNVTFTNRYLTQTTSGSLNLQDNLLLRMFGVVVWRNTHMVICGVCTTQLG
jgi:hypothetical protein